MSLWDHFDHGGTWTKRDSSKKRDERNLDEEDLDEGGIRRSIGTTSNAGIYQTRGSTRLEPRPVSFMAVLIRGL